MEEEVKDKVKGEPDQGSFEMDKPAQPHPAIDYEA